MIKAILIDPFKREVSRVLIKNDQAVWREVIQATKLERIQVGTVPDNNIKALDLWIENDIPFAESIAPCFCLRKDNTFEHSLIEVRGYGLMFFRDLNGETCSLSSNPHLLLKFVYLSKLQFEQWEKRLPGVEVDRFMGQVMRAPELELPGRFKYDKCTLSHHTYEEMGNILSPEEFAKAQAMNRKAMEESE